jgi:hypothetical protein
MSFRYIFFAILLMFCTVAFALDQDSDGILDELDNCIEAANGPILPDSGGNSQLDSDGDGYGNICDADYNGDDIVNFADLAYFRQAFGTADPVADLDGSGAVNFADLALFKLSFGKPPGPAGAGINPDEVASIELIASSSTLNSSVSGLTSITISAVVKNASNAVLQGITVVFGVDSGAFFVTQPITGEAGTAIGELSNGLDPSDRTITVTATADGVSNSIPVQVVGTELLLAGPDILAKGDTGSFVSVLTDSTGAGVSGQLLGVTSAQGNTITSTTLTTDATGKVSFEVTATQSGIDTLTISGLGINSEYSLNVSEEIFAFTAPALQPDGSPPEIALSSTVGEAVTVHWEITGVPQVLQTINFGATRGVLSATPDMFTPTTLAATDANGNATLYVASTVAGMSLIVAIQPSGATTTRSVEFVAVTPDTLSLQADRFTVPVNEQSEVTAIVRDANGNLVKNQTVNFILINDNTGGSINPASVVTGSDGRASIIYTSGPLPGPHNGVEIRAEVATAPSVTDTILLTVSEL